MYKIQKRVTLAIRALKQRKLRSSLSIIGIVCGVMAVFTMISIGEGAKLSALNRIEKMGIRNIYIRPLDLTAEERQRANDQLSLGLSVKDAEALVAQGSTVEDVAVFQEVRAVLHGTSLKFTPKVAACSENYAERYSLSLTEGRFFNTLDVLHKRQVSIIGSDVARQLGEQGRIGATLRIGNILLDVIGVLAENDPVDEGEGDVLSFRNFREMILVPLGLKPYLVPWNEQADYTGEIVSEIIVTIADGQQMHYAAEEVRNIIANLHNQVTDYEIIVPEELLEQANATRRIFNIVLGAIAGISLLVGGIGIMNIMLATVTERTREIGIRRAVGARRVDIVLQFLTEALLLTLMGGFVGILFGLVTTYAVSRYAQWPTAITGYAIVLPSLLSLAVGLFFGLYPAYNAAQMHPIKALRQEYY